MKQIDIIASGVNTTYRDREIQERAYCGERERERERNC